MAESQLSAVQQLASLLGREFNRVSTCKFHQLMVRWSASLSATSSRFFKMTCGGSKRASQGAKEEDSRHFGLQVAKMVVGSQTGCS